MSIKTTKRMALGVIASLVFAPFAAIAPASAATLTHEVDAITITTPTVTARVGDTVSTTFSVSADDATQATETFGLISTLTKPTASALTVADGDAGTNGSQATVNDTDKANTLTSTAYTSPKTKITAAGAITAATSTVSGTITFIPDAPGTYVYTLANATAADDAVAGNVTATFTVTVRSLAYTTGDTAAATPFSTGTGVAGVANTVTVTAHSTQTASQKALVTVSGAGATIQSASSATVSADFLSAVVNAQASSAVVIKTPQAGTVTVSLFNETAAGSGLYSTTAANTVTITVGAAAITGVYASSNVYMNTSTTLPTSTSDATTSTTPPSGSATASNTPIANILVSQVDAQATPVNVAQANTKAVVYEITGAGALGTANNQRLGSYIAVAAASANDNRVYIYPDGRSGVGTVSVKVNGVEVATKKVTFYGAVASYTLVTKNAIIAAGNSSDTQVLTVQALDANGVAVPSATVHVSSGTTTVATVDSATVTTGADGAAADIGVNGVAKGSAVITVGNAATSPTVSATATITIAAAGISSVAIAFDKASYLPGEKATLTITLKNADAALVGDEAYTNVFATGGVVPSSNLTTDMTATGVTSVNGVKTFTVYMPLIEGPVSVSATLGTGVATAAQATTVTASATVARPAAPEPEPVFEKPTLDFVVSGGRVYLSGTAADGEGDIIIYVKRVGTSAWKERAKTLEVAAPGDFNGSIRAPKNNVVIRVKQEGTGLFSNQIIVIK